MKMTKEELQKRIDEIKQGLEQSAANHNSILGRLAEAQFMLEKLEEAEKLCAGVVEEVCQ